eukprot:s856_g16.t1
MKLQEKRTAIELKMSNERMEALGGDLRWCNSHQQLADGTTKTSARQQFAATLQRRMHSLKYDPEGTASKKVKQSVRQEEEEEDSLDQAAKEFSRKKMIQDKIYKLEDMDAEDKEEIKVCILPGCGLPAEDGKRYCSKRHYHADQHKKKTSTASTAAAGVIWTLTMVNQTASAEAFALEIVVVTNYNHIMAFILAFALILVLVYNMGIRAGRREGQVRLANLAAAQAPTEQAILADQVTQTEVLESDEEGVRSDPSPRTRAATDCQRFTAGEIEHITDYGFNVFSDAEVNRIRQEFIDSLEPSIEDYLPQSEIDRIVRGDVDVPVVPLNAAEWNGIGRQQRAALLQALEDSLLLGIDFEEMTGDLQKEAACLRAELATIRAAGHEIQTMRMRSTLPDPSAIRPEAVLQALTALLSKERESWRMRAAAVASVRFAAAKHCQASTVLPLKEALLQCLGDEELQVRKAALHSVNVVCVSPTCSEILQDSTDLILERIKDDSKQRPELIREVDLGPFKHKVDDGLPLRKFAYTVCCSLLAAYPEQVASPTIIDLVLQGMGDNEDIQVICCQLLQDLCSWNFALFRIMGRVGDLVEPFDRCIMRWIKQVQAKQQVGRAMDMLRLYARTLKVVEPIAEANQHKVFVDFMGRILKDPAFAQVYEQATAGKDSL